MWKGHISVEYTSHIYMQAFLIYVSLSILDSCLLRTSSHTHYYHYTNDLYIPNVFYTTGIYLHALKLRQNIHHNLRCLHQFWLKYK